MKLHIFLRSAKKKIIKNISWHFEIFLNNILNLALWGWKFQNATPTIFVSSQPNFTWTRAVTFLGNDIALKFCGWNFIMEVKEKFLKCLISWKQLIVEGNGWKFGTCGCRNCICRVLISESVSSVWGHSVHFANFSYFVKIFEKLVLRQLSSNFNQTILWKVQYSWGIHAITFLAVCQI